MRHSSATSSLTDCSASSPHWRCRAEWRQAGSTTPTGHDDRDAARRIGPTALSDRSIAEIIKARAAAAGLPGTWSEHSLRRGFATQAYTAGVDELAIMRHGRWRSAAVMGTYIAEADRHRADSPVTALGLGASSDGATSNATIYGLGGEAAEQNPQQQR